MQKFLVKYGLAAHLAILAVAPLFLFAFGLNAVLATVVLWLTAWTAAWVFLSPSVHQNEALHQSRRRVHVRIVRDPLTWVSLLVLVFAGLRALNDGVCMAYDPETLSWWLKPARFAWYPSSVSGVGFLPFVAFLAVAVVILGVRHALGGSARLFFLLSSSFLSGVAALLALVFMSRAMQPKVLLTPQSGWLAADLAFTLLLVGGVMALVSVFERRWLPAVPVLFLAIAGNLVGAFAFGGPLIWLTFAAVLVLLVVYAVVYLQLTQKNNAGYRFLAVVGCGLCAGGVLSFVLISPDVLNERLAFLSDHRLFPTAFLQARAVLSEIALKGWKLHSWIGTGVGALPIVIKFGAADSDWSVISQGLTPFPNGWWQLLVERGIVGVVLMLSPVLLLAVVYVRKFASLLQTRQMLVNPVCWILPLFCLALAFLGLFGPAPFRVEVVIVLSAVCALSISSFPVERKDVR